MSFNLTNIKHVQIYLFFVLLHLFRIHELTAGDIPRNFTPIENLKSGANPYS